MHSEIINYNLEQVTMPDCMYMDPVTADELRDIRKALGVTQAELSQITGYAISRELISRIESGNKVACLHTTLIIRTALAYRLPHYSWANTKPGHKHLTTKRMLVYAPPKHRQP